MNESPRTLRPIRTREMPFVTYALMAISVIVYAIQYLTQTFHGVDIPLNLGARFGPLIEAGQWWRLFTPIFLHGSASHLAANMYSLFAVGPQIERYWGHTDFLLYYIISGLAGNVLSNIFSPNTISVGASTSLFGLIGAQALLIYKNRSMFRNYRDSLFRVLQVIGLNLLMGMRGHIDNWGHLGGLLGGALMAYLAGPTAALVSDPYTQQYELYDTVSRGKRLFTFALCAVLFLMLNKVF